jgi:hypothetical protein
MKIALSMSSAYHTPVDFWISRPVKELHGWLSVASDMSKEGR